MTASRLCRCAWLGHGTPEHEASPLCLSLRPDADRDPAPVPRGHTDACKARTDGLCECGAYMGDPAR